MISLVDRRPAAVHAAGARTERTCALRHGVAWRGVVWRGVAWRGAFALRHGVAWRVRHGSVPGM